MNHVARETAVLMNASESGRDDVTLTITEVTEFDRLITVFDVVEEHLLDPRLLTQVYSS